MNEILEIFSYGFIWRALIVGLLIAACSAVLGVNLVLKRYSMIGDGLSHVAFGAAAVAMALNAAPLALSIPVVLVAAFLLLRLGDDATLKGDAAIGLVSVSAVAIGVMFISMTSGMNTDVYSYLFGSVLVLDDQDVVLSIVLSLAVLLLYVLFYNRIFAVTFDESFAKATGGKATWYNMLLAALTAITIVLGMRMMGALLISGMLLIPALSAMRLCKNFKSVVITAGLLSMAGYVVGMLCSCFYALPTGAAVSAVQVIVFLIILKVTHD